jgi:hypothetical protein
MKLAGQAGLEPATTGFGVRRSSQLELLTPVSPLNFYLAMQGMGPARRTELLESQLFRCLLSVFRRCVIFSLTLIASKPHEFPHERSLLAWNYWLILVTIPAPTVFPPSRIANLSPSSIATGVISSISTLILSPGMTISVPWGSFTTPVTSVVRK